MAAAWRMSTSGSPGGSLNLKRAYSVWLRHFSVYQKLYKSSIMLNVADPVIYLTAMGFGLGALVRDINGIPYMNFIAPGILAYPSMFAATFECTYGTYIRMTHQKTFDAILATPVNIDDLVMGEILWGATKSLIYGIVIIIIVSLFGLIESPLIILAIPIIFICGIIFAQIAIIVTTQVPGIDYFSFFFTLLITPMFLFSGIFFPLENLHPAFLSIAFFTPLYHMVNVTRGLSNGIVPIWDILWILTVAVVLSPVPFKLMRRRIIK